MRVVYGGFIHSSIPPPLYLYGGELLSAWVQIRRLKRIYYAIESYYSPPPSPRQINFVQFLIGGKFFGGFFSFPFPPFS